MLTMIHGSCMLLSRHFMRVIGVDNNSTNHKHMKTSFSMFDDHTQGVGGRGLSVDFRKNDIRLIFHIFDALRTKNPSAQVVFLFVTLIEMGV